MQKHLISFNIILILFLSVNLKAQLISSSAEITIPTLYEVNGETDQVFMFNSENSSKNIQAETANNELAVFEWYTYNSETGLFQLISTTDSLSVSSLSVSENAGYQVVISGSGILDTAVCWVIINDLSVDIYDTDLEVEGEDTIKLVPEEQKWCHLIRDINARINKASSLSYYDLTSDTLVVLQTVHTVSWNANPVPEESGINSIRSNDELGLKIDIENPSWLDSWYRISVQDNFGIIARDSIFYESIEPHADFSFDYIRLDDPTYYPDKSDQYYEHFYGTNYDKTSAPAIFRFINLSVNTDTTIWDFGDDLKEIASADTILHTYELPGTYYPKMVVYNIVPHLYEACTDTFLKSGEEYPGESDYPPHVDEGSIAVDLPNVFSVPDYYLRFIGDVSITFFEIAIYNRYGKRIYHYEGHIRDWEGWDGKPKGSDSYVSTGVYYWVVKEINVLPYFKTGVKPKLSSGESGGDDPPPTTNLGTSTGSQDDEARYVAPNTIYSGYVHVYNNE